MSLPYVERSIVAQGDRAELYEMAKQPEKFPEYMPAVKQIEVVERGEGFAVTGWEVEAVGRRLRWKERDEYDDDDYRIRYQQVEGDLKKFEGEWRFEPTEGGVQITLTVDFDLGMPMLAPMLNPLLVKAVQANSDKMLAAMAEQASKTT